MTNPTKSEAEIRAEAIEEVASKWQWGSWTIVTQSVKEQSVIGVAQDVTEWLRAQAAKERGDEPKQP